MAIAMCKRKQWDTWQRYCGMGVVAVCPKRHFCGPHDHSQRGGKLEDSGYGPISRHVPECIAQTGSVMTALNRKSIGIEMIVIDCYSHIHSGDHLYNHYQLSSINFQEKQTTVVKLLSMRVTHSNTRSCQISLLGADT